MSKLRKCQFIQYLLEINCHNTGEFSNWNERSETIEHVSTECIMSQPSRNNVENFRYRIYTRNVLIQHPLFIILRYATLILAYISVIFCLPIY